MVTGGSRGLRSQLRLGRFAVALAVGAATLAAACSVLASEPEAATVVTVEAAPSCVEAAGLRERLSTLRPAPGAKEPPRRLEVTVVEANGTWRGEVKVTAADGAELTRTFTSDRCDEVVDALGLVGALAFGLESSPPQQPAPPVGVAGPATRPASHPAERGRWRFTASLRGDVITGVGPGVQVAPDLSVGAAFDSTSVFAPSLELSALWTTSGAFSVPPLGSATLTLTRGAATGCPVRLRLPGGFELRPCVDVAAGVLGGSATGQAVTASPTRLEPWLALAPVARVEWSFGSHVAVAVDAGPDVRVLHDRFTFVPSGTVARDLPLVGSVTRLGLLGLFP